MPMNRPHEIRDELLAIIKEVDVMFGILFPGQTIDPNLTVQMACQVQLIRHIDALGEKEEELVKV